MHAQRFGLGLALGLFFSTSLAWAIVIETPDGKKVKGIFSGDDGSTLKIEVRKDGKSEGIQSFERGKFKVVSQVDEQALERLSPNNAWGYVTAADGLAKLARDKDDPEARLRAKQCYLIAAKLRPKEFESKSLQSLIELADTDAEKRRYQAMAFLRDPKADEKMLKGESGGPTPSAQVPTTRDLDDLLKALRQYRTGDFKEAEKTARRPGLDKVFNNALHGKLSLKTFIDRCNSAFCPKCREDGTIECDNPGCRKGNRFKPNGDFLERCKECKEGRKVCPVCGGKHILSDSADDGTMRVVLQCESWALEQKGWSERPARQQAKEASNWSTLVQSKQLQKVPTLSLETLMPNFDPSKQHYYHKGEWVEKKAR